MTSELQSLTWKDKEAKRVGLGMSRLAEGAACTQARIWNKVENVQRLGLGMMRSQWGVAKVRGQDFPLRLWCFRMWIQRFFRGGGTGVDFTFREVSLAVTKRTGAGSGPETFHVVGKKPEN